MLDNEKRRALKDMKEDLEWIKQDLVERIIKETDGSQLDTLYRRYHELEDIQYHLACVDSFLKPLYIGE